MTPCLVCFGRGYTEAFIATRDGARLETAPCPACVVPGAYARRLAEILSNSGLSRPREPSPSPDNVTPLRR
jgi:hypothetical protein